MLEIAFYNNRYNHMIVAPKKLRKPPAYKNICKSRRYTRSHRLARGTSSMLEITLEIIDITP